MSERLHQHHEKHENLHLTEQIKENLEHARAAAEQAEARGEQHSVEALRHKVEEQAVSGQEYTIGEKESAPASHSFGTHKQLKADSYKRTLAHVRARLSRPERSFSKHIHGKRVEKIDTVVGNTVARPWGMLAGGACAFIGSLVILIFANHIGFRYNFGVFMALFFGGYLAGSLLEVFGRLVKRRQT